MKTQTEEPVPAGLLGRLASASVAHRRLVVVAWVVLIALAAGANLTWGGEFHNDLSVPDADSQAAFDELHERFPQRAGDPLQIVIHDENGVTDPATVAAVDDVLADIATIDGVTEVRSPWAGPAKAVSDDATTALATVQFAERTKDIPQESIDAVQDATASLADADLQVEFGGPPMEKQHGPSGSEAIGLVAAMAILLLAFGSVVAMFVPIGVALAALALGIQLVELLAGGVTIGTAGPVVAGMIGLGVGIDYALLIVTRHRENTARGMTPEESIPVAMATAGRSVLVAGLTVIVAILSLYLIGIDFVAAIGLASATTVATTLLASITLLPALLGFAGHNIDRWSLRAFHHVGRHEQASGWRRWVEGVQRRPWLSFVAALTVLLVLAVPLFSMRLGSGDAGADPTTETTRRAYDLVAEGFGPGYNGPLPITVTSPDGFTMPAAGDVGAGGDGSGPGDATQPSTTEPDATPGPGEPGQEPDAEMVAAQMPPELAELWSQLRATPGVAAVAPPDINADGDVAVLAVIPTTSPQAEATEDLVHALRDDILPTAVEGDDLEVHVGGPTAVTIDLADKMADRLPHFVAGILVLSFLLLMVEFRSLFVPFKAALMNLLSIGAAYGAVVAVFQWGWLSDVFGQATGPIESFAPMMLFAVLFGLSMDYEVFLLSRVREEYDKTGDNSHAVSVGISATARVITAAASVMIIVFGAFLFNDQRVVQMFGFGLAIAILVDATIVRTVLVPATMELAGRANWWLPGWLDRLLPELHAATPPASGQTDGGGQGSTQPPRPAEQANDRPDAALATHDQGSLDELRAQVDQQTMVATSAVGRLVDSLEDHVVALQLCEEEFIARLEETRLQRHEAEHKLSEFQPLALALPDPRPALVAGRTGEGGDEAGQHEPRVQATNAPAGRQGATSNGAGSNGAGEHDQDVGGHARNALDRALRAIPGAGVVERATLLEAFGSLEEIRSVSTEDLADLPEIDDRLAAVVHVHLTALES